MTYYYYKIHFKDNTKRDIYLKDITKTDLLGYIQNKEVKDYNNLIINWGEVKQIKCHELKDTNLTKIIDGTEKTMKAANE